MTVSMKVVIAAAVAVVPLGTLFHYRAEEARARADWERTQAEYRQREQREYARVVQERDRKAALEKAERDRRAALAQKARRLVPPDSSNVDRRWADIQGGVLVWDVSRNAQAIADTRLSPELRLGSTRRTGKETARGLLALVGPAAACPAACLISPALLPSVGEPPVTVFLILAMERTQVRTYHIVRTETVYEYRERGRMSDPPGWRPGAPPPMPGRVRMGPASPFENHQPPGWPQVPGWQPPGFNPNPDFGHVPGMPPSPLVPHVRQVDTGQRVPGYRVDLLIAAVYLPQGTFAGRFRVAGADPPENISRQGDDISPEIGPTDSALVQWILNSKRNRSRP